MWHTVSKYGWTLAKLWLQGLLVARTGLDIQNARKISNGRKIARIAPIWTKIWQNRSQRWDLSFPKFLGPPGFKKIVFKIFFHASCLKNCLNIYRWPLQALLTCSWGRLLGLFLGGVTGAGERPSDAVEKITISTWKWKTFRKFSKFSATGAPRCTIQNFGNDSPCQCDQFCPKIVEIGAILAIFRPFEIFPKIFTSLACESHRQNYKGIKSTASCGKLWR